MMSRSASDVDVVMRCHTVFGFAEDDAKLFAVGVDAAIVTCLVLDLFMATIRTSWPLLRLLAQAVTGASIYFNAAAHGPVTEHWDMAASHGLMPVLFVVGTEAGRRILVHEAALPADHDVIPGHRWLLAAGSTWRIYRTMKLWEVGYSEAMARQRERAIFHAWNEYKAELKKSGLEVGSEEALARLPRKLGPFGLTVDEALALPDQMAREELRRQQEANKRARRLELDRERAEHAAAKERIAHRKEKVALVADLRATEGVAAADADAAVAAANTRAQATATAAAKAAEAEAQALETEAAARARAEAAAHDRQAQEDRKAAAEAAAAAAEAQRRETETRRRLLDEQARKEATQADIARAKRERAEAEKAAAEALREAAETREAVAEIELRAVEAEDLARLSPRERAARRVARMILARGGVPAALPLEDIKQALGVSSPATASEYRQEAAELLAGGYRPDGEARSPAAV
ncbi:DUF2637 domain-containing protein [Streptomyces hoynatensis]|uniref:DUF2637 domain-containing protein n=1 Tax=Streptomyces hoynatensis TaxID=1141874 RepID=A0A3A9YIV4_9ACTN|nr:DUF2637 domain-containing protein [Streptomyces hoynatensis]RKN36719.1 DUF2637 domain-containing protein [Streptomyces hoynatensis]